MIAAMKSGDVVRLNTLRAVKTAFDRYRVDKGVVVDEQICQSVLKTMIKQRKESSEAFRSGGREAMALREEAEIRIIESYLPQEASEEEIEAAVMAAIFELTGSENIAKKNVPKHLGNKRGDGKLISEKVKSRICQ